MSTRGMLLLVLVLTTGGCSGQDDDPEGAKQLWSRINEGAGFRTWGRAPGFPTRKPSFTLHADAVEIFVNPSVEAALAGPAPITTWPDGSIVVKEGFSGNRRALVAVMEKRAGRWFWAEYDADGKAAYSGSPTVCIECHEKRKSFSDWVYSFELPR